MNTITIDQADGMKKIRAAKNLRHYCNQDWIPIPIVIPIGANFLQSSAGNVSSKSKSVSKSKPLPPYAGRVCKHVPPLIRPSGAPSPQGEGCLRYKPFPGEVSERSETPGRRHTPNCRLPTANSPLPAQPGSVICSLAPDFRQAARQPSSGRSTAARGA
jgi:hypothetical protein